MTIISVPVLMPCFCDFLGTILISKIQNHTLKKSRTLNKRKISKAAKLPIRQILKHLLKSFCTYRAVKKVLKIHNTDLGHF